MYVKFPPQPPAGREPSETCQAGNIPSINIYNVSTHYRSYKDLVRLGKQAARNVLLLLQQVLTLLVT